MTEYLEDKGWVEVGLVKAFADRLCRTRQTSFEKAEILFRFVRDQISHSGDILNPVKNGRASDVLLFRHGLCYAKSILLAALLRSQNIPAGFGYQQMKSGDLWSLHGYNHIYMKDSETWVKADTRGGEKGSHVELHPTDSSMVYPVRKDLGEKDINMNYSYPPQPILDFLDNGLPLDFSWIDLPKNL